MKDLGVRPFLVNFLMVQNSRKLFHCERPAPYRPREMTPTPPVARGKSQSSFVSLDIYNGIKG
jgi:hypothetical protein